MLDYDIVKLSQVEDGDIILLKGIDDVSQSIKELFIKTVREVTAKRLVFVAMATDLSMKVMKPSEFDTLLKELRKKNEKDNH